MRQFADELDKNNACSTYAQRSNLCKKFIKDSVGRQLFRVIQETPEFEAYLLVSKLESEISLTIDKVCHLWWESTFTMIKFQIF